MISLKNLKDLMTQSPASPTTDDFIRIHKSVEGYIRRLQFIGLRLNNVKYSTAQDVISLSYLNNRDLIKKTIKWITLSRHSIEDFEAQNADLKVLLDLFFDFSSIYRNRLTHGIYDKINNQEVLKHCYYVDKYLIVEFESTLSQLGYKSAFNEPNEWGATAASSTETVDQVIARLRIGNRITKSPKGIISVKNTIAQTSYNGRI